MKASNTDLHDALIAADPDAPGGGTTTGVPLLLGFAVVRGVDGVVLAQKVATGITLTFANDPAYTPGSGDYNIPVTGPSAPTTAIVSAQIFQGGGAYVRPTYAAGNINTLVFDAAGVADEAGAFTVFLYKIT